VKAVDDDSSKKHNNDDLMNGGIIAAICAGGLLFLVCFAYGCKIAVSKLGASDRASSASGASLKGDYKSPIHDGGLYEPPKEEDTSSNRSYASDDA
jgi:hypothetical protein